MSDTIFPYSVELSRQTSQTSFFLTEPSATKCNSEEPAIKDTKKKCAECNRSIKIVSEFVCKCGKVLCSKHKFSDTHKCEFDHRAAWKQTIQRHNPTIQSSKIEKI